VTGAVRPGPEELARLQPPPPAPAYAAQATASTAAELARLRLRVPRPARPPRRGLLVAAAVALVLLAALLHGQSPAPHPVPGELAVLTQDAWLAFGPSIRVWGDGRLSVLRSGEGGTLLDLLEGGAWFEVDPEGEQRSLEVRAGEVSVQVTGTRFFVEHAGLVRVQVERGSVRVRRPAGALTLVAGEVWSSEVAAPVALAELPEPSTAAPSVAAQRAPAPVTLPAPVVVLPAPAVLPAAPEAAGELSPDLALAWAAILDHRQQGVPAQALVLEIERFLEGCAQAPLCADAAMLRLELLPSLLPGEEVIAELDTWLLRYPAHPRRLEAHYLRATVAREQLEDCGLALPSYERVAREATGTLRQRAQQWSAACEP